ncbi:hypothetical protein Bhyg_14757, partial [Pseudolycoriella hygida]
MSRTLQAHEFDNQLRESVGEFLRVHEDQINQLEKIKLKIKRLQTIFERREDEVKRLQLMKLKRYKATLRIFRYLHANFSGRKRPL